ncbi:2-C-methyl-D-erythritol 4-phosphate cytidylyltransferase [Flammeovirga kamogawensis]|uniref:2-C-methyl-D-erythritol 4-phosphate cytidylyltransferase n=1 Tax=Flammeovirga kamogawensis TaxID=373891 RepID=A0ABX8GSM4_9BACT|nr:2-C-methyl-D-erythritol 4-phosphate cytidylyltransferase [Flammeovirga kamogawensis]MBB6461347.1 2-C-methyl-D-erythritol 4-phosphate cytidylyltransferase [Flammeovirga kamogawensis]QWG06252.1 2-C-methyl-D-erythritol 4-phosphate cytidylyltransferase [Flammeovirga kamogawensis]TRX68082.1 2-C-methyl-D-erythritol 4-phosphate cytidylyltransferase [Flammeovirga kamogawensis]
MKKYSIIVAGGKGTRMQSSTPKQFLIVNGLPILMHTINKFFNAESDNHIILALPKDQIGTWKALIKEYNFSTPHQVITGGDTRFQSVDNAIQYIPNQECLIAIHDGVRPLVATSVIQRSFKEALEHGSAIPTVAVKESIREVTPMGNKAMNRDEFVLVQTPQTFRSDVLFPAFENAYNSSFTDDASVAEFAGFKMHLFEGNNENIKITTPEDLKIGATLLA